MSKDFNKLFDDIDSARDIKDLKKVLIEILDILSQVKNDAEDLKDFEWEYIDE